MHYRNFDIAVYIPAGISNILTEERLAKDYAFIEKYIGLDKVYIETHRSSIAM